MSAFCFSQRLPVLPVLLLCATGCTTPESAYQATCRTDTAAAYLAYLEAYPTAERATDIRSRLEDRERDALARNPSVKAHESYLAKYPHGRHWESVVGDLEGLYFSEATAAGSIAAFESFVNAHPKSRHVEDARLRMRALELASAGSTGTVAAYEAFLTRYPRGIESDGLRKTLPVLQAKERAFALAAAIMKLAPSTAIELGSTSVGNGFVAPRVSGLTSTPPSERDATEALELVSRLLREGADPRLVRVTDFKKPGKEVLEAGVAEIWSSGSPGRIVSADQGGMTLLDYCGQNDLKAAARLLREHAAR